MRSRLQRQNLENTAGVSLIEQILGQSGVQLEEEKIADSEEK